MVLPFSMDIQQTRRDRWRNQQSRRRDGEPFHDHILGRANLANIDAVRGAGMFAAAGAGTAPLAPRLPDQILDSPRAKGFRARDRLSESFGSLSASKFNAARFRAGSGDVSWPRKSVASKVTPGACWAVPRHEAVMPLTFPVNLTSTSSMPKTVGGPAACLLVVSAAVNRSSSTSYEPL